MKLKKKIALRFAFSSFLFGLYAVQMSSSPSEIARQAAFGV